nr:hypothetical protein [Brevundimonas sp. Bb-A]
MQRDLHRCARFRVHRFDVDAGDQVADGVDHFTLGRVGAVAGLGQARLKVGDAIRIGLGRAGVKPDRRRRVRLDLGQGLLDLGALAAHLGQLGADDGRRRVAGQQGVGPSVDRPIQLGQAAGQRRAAIFVLCRPLAPSLMVGADVGGDGFRRQQPFAQSGQDALLDHGARDVPVVGAGRRALFTIVDADQPPCAERGVGAAAPAALQQAGQQAGATPQLDQLGRIDVPAAEDAGLGAVPQRPVEDGQVRHGHPLVLRGGAGDGQAPSGLAVFPAFDAAIDLDPRIDLAVEHAVRAAGGAGDGGGRPGAAPGGGDVFAVQQIRDGAGRHLLVRVEGEDAADDGRLLGHDFDQAAGGGAVAVEAGAGRQALFGVGGQAALGLLRQDLDVFRRHERFERHLHARHLDRRQGGDRNAGGAQPVIDVPLVLFVAGQAVFVLDQEDVVFAALGRRDGVQQARPVRHGLTRDRRVHIGGRHRPAPRLGRGGQDLQLVGDRARILAVVAVAGVEGGAVHGRQEGLRRRPDASLGSRAPEPRTPGRRHSRGARRRAPWPG